MSDAADRWRVRVRMAPSPSGPIHIGNVHTALFNWLFARQQHGAFVLRFEDTDAARSERRWEDVIYSELRWLGIDWDEAPDIGGPWGPYRQTERLGLYHEWAQRLLECGAAYECFCSVEELEADRADANATGRAYQYSRKCRCLTAGDRARLRAAGAAPAIRLAIPDDQIVVIDDLIRGRIEFPTSALGDPIIVRPNGVPLYNFAVVVDDLTMGITHVLRGEGHISNTPLQVLLYGALGQPLPAFGHLGHINSGTGSKLSKRRGEGYIGHYRDLGILPEAMFNYLAMLAWTPGDDREIMTRDEILAQFDLSRVTAAPSQFDYKKLLWFNGQHIRRLTVPELTDLCLPYLVQAGLVTEPVAEAALLKAAGICALEQTRIETLAQIVDAASYYFCTDLQYTPQAVKLIERSGVREHLTRALEALAGVTVWDLPSLESTGAALLAELELEAKALYQPIRSAVTGRTFSPPLFDTLYWIGRDAALSRLQTVTSGRPLPMAAPPAPED